MIATTIMTSIRVKPARARCREFVAIGAGADGDGMHWSCLG